MPLIETTRAPIDVTEANPTAASIALLIHGAGGNRLQWPPALRRHDDTRVLSIDLPGHGRSPAPGRDTIDDYAADIVALMDALDIGAASLIGHSMGGAIALSVAADHAARVDNLVILNSGAMLDVSEEFMDLLRTDTDAAIGWMARRLYGDDDTRRAAAEKALGALPPGVLRDDYLACDRYDLRDRAPTIAVPTLVISGLRDSHKTQQRSLELADLLPIAALVQLETGHMAHLEQPDRVAEAIKQWLA